MGFIFFLWDWEKCNNNLSQTIDPDLLEDYEPYEYADPVTVPNDVTVPPDCDLFYLDCDMGRFEAALYLDKVMFYNWSI